METIKIQKFLANAGISSRRAAEKLVEAGKVSVNGRTATIGQRIDPTQDKVLYNNKPINGVELKYYLINKPAGIVTTTKDEMGRKAVLSILPDTITGSTRLYPVGRLDKDSEGLLLVTNDGAFTHLLTHPSHLITKTYRIFIDRKPTYKALQHLRRGVLLREGLTEPAEVETEEDTDRGTWLTMTIKEGKNRQVRRMLERVGYDTIRLIRTKFGPYLLSELQNQSWIEVEKRPTTKSTPPSAA
ncbi:MAG: rRNA pseudouridine synthase [Candidatus Pacebacteria bacterium]|jgi:23S rRNA pseudouridine2605 synthase|nr:rRNA pseudouridine synthase [Candidatus Paceibacterota bacterium]MBT3512277.1 rRNA pseudouridine synthase [Candidatus Paceibacterota bacterium]MBT4004529.1 rRNA pseudouridine synthase [Candidatus Paceibacterota bacterium]MBT4358861.1 rRNA pseudouridine synthase [Candidatus Paceibacterota bacterium]MBT4681190.1 rRNA pseudouridine synthase [Candidatus Paceibacterota bacterium]